MRPNLRLSAACLCLSATASLPAQAPSRWVDLHIAAGVSSTAITLSERLVLYRAGTFLRVFSAATGRWDAFTPSFGTTPILKADLLLVPESDRWTAYSAYRGVFAVQLASFANSTLTATASLAVVREGSQLHTFSAFTGSWTSRSLPAGWSLFVADRIAVIGDTASVQCSGASAFDAYTGQWRDLPAQAARLQPAVITAGSAALLDFTAYQLGFSAQHPVWARDDTAWARHSSLQGQHTDMVISCGTVFSGLSGTFAPSPLTAPAMGVHQVDGLVASADANGQQYVCGANGSGWRALPAGAAVINAYRAVDAVMLYQIGGNVAAYSGATDTSAVSAIAYGGFNSWDVSGATAAAVDAVTNRPALFSAMTGQWYTPPATVGGALPWLSQAGAMLRGGGSAIGFSSYTGAFVPLGGTGITAFGGYPRGVLAAADAGTLHVFDGRTARWRSQALATAAAQFDIRGNVLVAAAGTRAVGFGERSGRCEAVALPQPVLAVGAFGDVGMVRTADHLLAFAGLPDSLPWSTFPFGNSAAAIGTTLRQQLSLPGGSIGILGIGPRQPAAVATPFGELWLGPGITTLLLAPPAGEGRAVVPLPIPTLAVLQQSEWVLQALVLPPSAPPYLGDAAVLRVL